MKKKSQKLRYAKIHYSNLSVRFVELFILFVWSCVLGLGASIVAFVSTGVSKYFQNNQTVWGIMAAVFIPALLLIFLCYLVVGRERRKIMKKNRFIKKNGTRVLGDIISLERTEAHREDGGKNFTYSYNIQYVNPEDDSLVVIKTPSVVENRMLIKESDLPLKAVVYLYEKQAYVESIINPPYRSMFLRKLFKYLPYPLGFCAILCVSIINETSSQETVVIRSVFSICIILCVAGAFVSYSIKDRF